MNSNYMVTWLREASTATDRDTLLLRCHEAADEIERLRGLITQMVDAYDFRVDGVISADDYLMGVLDLLRDEARRD